MSSIALRDVDTRRTGSRVTWRIPAHLRLLRRVASRAHARRVMATEMGDPRWRADIGLSPMTEGKGLTVLAMSVWPFGS